MAEHNSIQAEVAIPSSPEEGNRPRYWALNVIGVALIFGNLLLRRISSGGDSGLDFVGICACAGG